jgi:hypothetical protein
MRERAASQEEAMHECMDTICNLIQSKLSPDENVRKI